ncbi:MAG: hypothetical protein LBT89_02315 [Planctomycetaceae bacterium]|jgi:endonuclease-3 related protein|nr:hypothetical protein [Planctomycetaceae bacterium]
MSILRKIFETLREYYADKPYRWWSDYPVEVIVRAVLVQGSTWKSVDKVIETMYPQGFMEFEAIVQLPDKQLAAVIRPARFQKKKVPRLKALAKLFLEYGGNTTRFFARDIETVRQELLHVPGIGVSTADNIMLYAGNIPVYMIDMFTVRLLRRHGFVSPTADDKAMQECVLQELTPDEEPYGAELFKKMQEYVVRISKDFCSKTNPKCNECPLRIFLPEDAAIQTDSPPLIRKTAKAAAFERPAKPISPHPVAPQPVAVQPIEMPADWTDAERKVFANIGNEATPIDKVAESAQLPIHIVRATIAMLQMKKAVRQTEGNNVVRTQPKS